MIEWKSHFGTFINSRGIEEDFVFHTCDQQWCCQLTNDCNIYSTWIFSLTNRSAQPLIKSKRYKNYYQALEAHKRIYENLEKYLQSRRFEELLMEEQL